VCSEPSLELLAPLIDVAPGGAHLALTTTTTASGVTGDTGATTPGAATPSHAQLRFGTFVPDATGAVGLSLMGTLLDGNNGAGVAYSVGRAEATQLRAVPRTPEPEPEPEPEPKLEPRPYPEAEAEP
jgi:hypothetical protein